MMMGVEQSVKLELEGQSEVLTDSMPQCYIVHHKSNMSLLGIEPRLLWWEASD
jgi:hypothetical protein